jgi:hypothetical protein
MKDKKYNLTGEFDIKHQDKMPDWMEGVYKESQNKKNEKTENPIKNVDNIFKFMLKKD